MPDPAIREARPEEADQVAQIVRASFAETAERLDLTPDLAPRYSAWTRPEWVRERMDEGVRYFLLSAGGAAVGCIGLQKRDDGSVYLCRLAVLPEHRGQGHGRRLLEHALAEGRRLGAARARLAIVTAVEELGAWYMRLGFEVTETKPPGEFPRHVTYFARDLDREG